MFQTIRLESAVQPFAAIRFVWRISVPDRRPSDSFDMHSSAACDDSIRLICSVLPFEMIRFVWYAQFCHLWWFDSFDAFAQMGVRQIYVKGWLTKKSGDICDYFDSHTQIPSVTVVITLRVGLFLKCPRTLFKVSVHNYQKNCVQLPSYLLSIILKTAHWYDGNCALFRQ